MVCEMTASYTADRLEESAVPAYQNSEGSIHLSVRLQLVRYLTTVVVLECLRLRYEICWKFLFPLVACSCPFPV